MASERSKGPEPAGEHDDLLMLAGPAQRVEHALDTIVVAIDQRIVQDDGSDLTALGQHRAHRETHENSNLLLRPVRQPLEQLGTLALDAGDSKPVAEFEFGARKQIV